MAAVLAVGGDAMLSHTAAAALWGIWRGPCSAHVVTSRRHHGLRHACVHRSSTLERCDMGVRFGIRLTSVARTLLDLGDELTPHQLAFVLRQARRLRLLDLRAVRDVMRRNAGGRAVGVLAQALELHLAQQVVDAARDARLRRAGYDVVRCRPHQLQEHLKWLARRLVE